MPLIKQSDFLLGTVIGEDTPLSSELLSEFGGEIQHHEVSLVAIVLARDEVSRPLLLEDGLLGIVQPHVVLDNRLGHNSNLLIIIPESK